MKRYEVTISWRPNASSLARVSEVFFVTARSQASAIFQAAYRLGSDGTSYLPGSENVTVRYVRSTW